MVKASQGSNGGKDLNPALVVVIFPPMQFRTPLWFQASHHIPGNIHITNAEDGCTQNENTRIGVFMAAGFVTECDKSHAAPLTRPTARPTREHATPNTSASSASESSPESLTLTILIPSRVLIRTRSASNPAKTFITLNTNVTIGFARPHTNPSKPNVTQHRATTRNTKSFGKKVSQQKGGRHSFGVRSTFYRML
jgi:hypothetical protein